MFLAVNNKYFSKNEEVLNQTNCDLIKPSLLGRSFQPNGQHRYD